MFDNRDELPWFRVEGNSMDRAGLQDGDEFQYRPQPTAEDGDIVLVDLADGQRVVKRYVQTSPCGDFAGGWVSPDSSDPSHRSRPLLAGDVIVGVLVDKPDMERWRERIKAPDVQYGYPGAWPMMPRAKDGDWSTRPDPAPPPPKPRRAPMTRAEKLEYFSYTLGAPSPPPEPTPPPSHVRMAHRRGMPPPPSRDPWAPRPRKMYPQPYHACSSMEFLWSVTVEQDDMEARGIYQGDKAGLDRTAPTPGWWHDGVVVLVDLSAHGLGVRLAELTGDGERIWASAPDGPRYLIQREDVRGFLRNTLRPGEVPPMLAMALGMKA